MVSYQTLTKLAFEIAEEKGSRPGSLREGGAFVADVAEYWNANKDRLKGLTEEQAREDLRRVVQ